MRLLICLFLLLTLFSCDSPTVPTIKRDTSKIGNTGEPLEGLAHELNNNDTVKSSWGYRTEEDKMTGQKTQFATISADESLHFAFPYNGINYPSIMIQKRRGETSILLIVDKGQILERMIHIRFDSLRMESIYASNPGDGDSRYAFLGNAGYLIARLKKAKHVIVEAEFYREGIQQMEFNCTGLNWPPRQITK